MDFGLAGKVAMVAAGSKGIGFATAQELVREGCRVSICSRNQANLEVAVAELGPEVRGTVCDVSVPAQLTMWLKETVAAFGQPEILVTNTGGPPAGPMSTMSDQQWQDGFESTLMNVVRLTRMVAPIMVERNWGRIVHITSLVAKEPAPMLPISSTLRAGLMALTRSQSNDLAQHGITVNSVLPGHTMTDRQTHLAEVISKERGISPAEALDEQARRIPRGTLGQPSEIAAAIAFLCSVRAGFITGINLLADGGAVKGLS